MRYVSRAGLLVGLDVAGILAAYFLAHQLRFGQWASPFSGSLWILVVVAILALYAMDMYRMDDSRDPVRFSGDALAAVFVVAAASVFVVYILGREQYDPIFGRAVLPVALALFALWAALSRWLFAKWYQHTLGVIHWLMIDTEESVARFNQDIQATALRTDPSRDVPRFEAETRIHEIESWIREHPERSCIVHADSLAPEVKPINQSQSPVTILSVTGYYEQYWKLLPVDHFEEDMLHLSRHNLTHKRTGFRVKRIVDCLIAVVSLIGVSPLMLLIGVMIRLHSPGRIIYRQQRVGLNGKVFTLYKFRTMFEDAEKSGVQWADADDPRITRLGRFLRASHIDELPQLWNLILGNMSLIGPRPERPEFVSLLQREIPHYLVRHIVPPGITGWAQVKYPYGSSVKDARHKLEYDLYYIKNHTLRLDMTIVIKTAMVMLKRLGR